MVSNIFHFHPYSGKWSHLTHIFQMGWNHQLVVFWHKNSTFRTRSFYEFFFHLGPGWLFIFPAQHFSKISQTVKTPRLSPFPALLSLGRFKKTTGGNNGGKPRGDRIDQHIGPPIPPGLDDIPKGKSGRHRSVAAGTLLHYILLSEGYSTLVPEPTWARVLEIRYGCFRK